MSENMNGEAMNALIKIDYDEGTKLSEVARRIEWLADAGARFAMDMDLLIENPGRVQALFEMIVDLAAPLHQRLHWIERGRATA